MAETLLNPPLSLLRHHLHLNTLDSHTSTDQASSVVNRVTKARKVPQDLTSLQLHSQVAKYLQYSAGLIMRIIHFTLISVALASASVQAHDHAELSKRARDPVDWVAPPRPPPGKGPVTPSGVPVPMPPGFESRRWGSDKESCDIGFIDDSCRSLHCKMLVRGPGLTNPTVSSEMAHQFAVQIPTHPQFSIRRKGKVIRSNSYYLETKDRYWTRNPVKPSVWDFFVEFNYWRAKGNGAGPTFKGDFAVQLTNFQTGFEEWNGFDYDVECFARTSVNCCGG